MKAATIYIIVQLLAYGLDVGTFVAMHRLYEVAAIPSNVAAKIVAGCFAFFAHRHVTFAAASHGSLVNQAVRYVLLLLVNSLASSAILALLLKFAPPVPAKILADTILIVISFSLSKSVVFRRAKASNGQ